MVKDHSDSERGNLLPPLHGLLFVISSKCFFICIVPDRIAHTTAFATPVVENWLEREMAERVSQRERKPTAATWATLSDQQQVFFYVHHPTDRTAHTTAFATPVVENWLEREIAEWVRHCCHMGYSFRSAASVLLYASSH